MGCSSAGRWYLGNGPLAGPVTTASATTGAASVPTAGIGLVPQDPASQDPVPGPAAVRAPRTLLAAIIGPVAVLPPEAAARAIPSCANIDTARIGAEPELPPASGTGAELRLS